MVSSENATTFEFDSLGVKGRIKKIIQYSPANYKNIYNLGFGDKDLLTGQIDDTIISNNGDYEKVLPTVVASLYVFTDRNQDALIYAAFLVKRIKK